MQSVSEWTVGTRTSAQHFVPVPFSGDHVPSPFRTHLTLLPLGSAPTFHGYGDEEEDQTGGRLWAVSVFFCAFCVFLCRKGRYFLPLVLLIV